MISLQEILNFLVLIEICDFYKRWLYLNWINTWLKIWVFIMIYIFITFLLLKTYIPQSNWICLQMIQFLFLNFSFSEIQFVIKIHYLGWNILVSRFWKSDLVYQKKGLLKIRLLTRNRCNIYLVSKRYDNQYNSLFTKLFL